VLNYGRLKPYSQELNWAGKAYQRLQHITKIDKSSEKSFITLDPGERKWEKLIKSLHLTKISLHIFQIAPKSTSGGDASRSEFEKLIYQHKLSLL
jgi:hypothetical protein